MGQAAPPPIHEVSRSHTQRPTTVGRTPLDEWSARRRDLYLSNSSGWVINPSQRPLPDKFLWMNDQLVAEISIWQMPLDEWSARRRDLYLTNSSGWMISSSQRPLPDKCLWMSDQLVAETPTWQISLDEWSARRRDLYLTTHNTHNRHSCPRWDSKPQSQQASGRRPTP